MPTAQQLNQTQAFPVLLCLVSKANKKPVKGKANKKTEKRKEKKETSSSQVICQEYFSFPNSILLNCTLCQNKLCTYCSVAKSNLLTDFLDYSQMCNKKK